MPLRITNQEDSSLVSKKKLHKKMSRVGHYQRVRRPTGLEVYTDAARILEELLEKRIDDDVKVNPHTKRNKSDPTRDYIRTPERGDNSNNAVARSQTMPSRYRESTDEALKKKDQDRLRDIAASARHDDTDSDSSMNTADDEVKENDAKRKKKSPFKRAVQRLKHVFHRDQKEGSGYENEAASPPNKRHVKGIHKHKKKCVYKDKNLHHPRSTDCKSPFEIEVEEDPEDHTPGSSTKQNRSPHKTHHFVGMGGRINEPSTVDSRPPRTDSSRDSAHRPQSFEHGNKDSSLTKSSSSSTSPRHDLSTILAGLRTNGDDDRTETPNSSLANWSEENLRSSRSNILDSPGEEIEYMDGVDSPTGDVYDTFPNLAPPSPSHISNGHNTPGVKYHGSKGLLDMTWLAGHAVNGVSHLSDEVINGGPGLGGASSSHAAHNIPGNMVNGGLPVLMEEETVDGATAAEVERPRTEAEKEEMYSKVAQRLVEMADNLTLSLSDHEGRQRRAVEEDQPQPVVLSDLENRIIECLRSGGDRNSRQFDEAMTETRVAAQTEAYNRFRTTVENSMGRELSWEYLSFLFYTTKGVVSAVGKGSQAAVQAKEFTLQYISDTFATWLIDQGGFDSMLSDTEETDYELD